MPRSYSRGVFYMSEEDDSDAQLSGLEMDAFAIGNGLDGVGEPGVFNEFQDRRFQLRLWSFYFIFSTDWLLSVLAVFHIL
jgi:hypothetical protein